METRQKLRTNKARERESKHKHEREIREIEKEG